MKIHISTQNTCILHRLETTMRQLESFSRVAQLRTNNNINKKFLHKQSLRTVRNIHMNANRPHHSWTDTAPLTSRASCSEEPHARVASIRFSSSRRHGTSSASPKRLSYFPHLR